TSDSVDESTISSDNIQVIDPFGNPVTGNFNTDAAGGVISFTPITRLAPYTEYSIQTTVGLRDLDGNPFGALTSSFFTGENGVQPAAASFDKITLDNIDGPTVVAMGPDG